MIFSDALKSLLGARTREALNIIETSAANTSKSITAITSELQAADLGIRRQTVADVVRMVRQPQEALAGFKRVFGPEAPVPPELHAPSFGVMRKQFGYTVSIENGPPDAMEGINVSSDVPLSENEAIQLASETLSNAERYPEFQENQGELAFNLESARINQLPEFEAPAPGEAPPSVGLPEGAAAEEGAPTAPSLPDTISTLRDVGSKIAERLAAGEEAGGLLEELLGLLLG